MQEFPYSCPDNPFSVSELIKTMQTGHPIHIHGNAFLMIENASCIFARSLKNVGASPCICFAVVHYTIDYETGDLILPYTVCRMEITDYDPNDIEKCTVTLKGINIEECLHYFSRSFPPDMMIKEPSSE